MQWMHLFTAIPYILAWSHYREGGNYIDGLYLAVLVHAMVLLGTMISCLMPRHLLAPSPLDLVSIQIPTTNPGYTHGAPTGDCDGGWAARDDGPCFNPANGSYMPFGRDGFDMNGNMYGCSGHDDWP
jgi:hypothetical protein